MSSEVRSGKRRERAEAYALQAAEAEQRGDHRMAAVLYQAAFLALESNDESGVDKKGAEKKVADEGAALPLELDAQKSHTEAE
jgi:hypothetical protein